MTPRGEEEGEGESEGVNSKRRKSEGKVFLVGAGPGDPELITLKAIRALRSADVVLYDYLANPELLRYAPDRAEKIDVGKIGGGRAPKQEAIVQKLLSLAEGGKRVVRLKGGDPFLFGRGGEEAEALSQRGIPFEVVPGVSSAIAVPAYAGIPVTDRRFASAVTIATGHEDPSKKRSVLPWVEMARAGQTLVLLMGIQNLERNVKKLIASGCDPKSPAALIEWGTWPRQRTVTAPLGRIVMEGRRAKVGAPAVFVLGEVVSLRRRLQWWEERPLSGRSVLVTRAREQASEFVEKLRELGAEAIELPAVEIRPPRSWKEVDSTLKRLKEYDWVIFTSVNGVRSVVERLRRLRRHVGEEFQGLSIAAIGPRTAEEVERYGLRVDLIPKEFRSEAIVSAFRRRRLKGKRVLIPRAEVARDLLPDALQKRGAKVKVLPVYRTHPARIDGDWLNGRLRGKGVDVLAFTSSSTVHSFARHFSRKELKRWVDGAVVACIGPITGETVRSYGIEPQIVAKEYTIPGLANAIVEYFT